MIFLWAKDLPACACALFSSPQSTEQKKSRFELEVRISQLSKPYIIHAAIQPTHQNMPASTGKRKQDLGDQLPIAKTVDEDEIGDDEVCLSDAVPVWGTLLTGIGL